MTSRLAPAVALLVLVGGTTARARVSYLAGGGPAADDCLASVEVTGVEVGPRARTVVCEDVGSPGTELEFAL